MEWTRRYYWLMGLLGFLGFLGVRGEPVCFLLFAAFGNFGYYWWNKLGDADERLYRNKYFAAQTVFQWVLLSIFILSVFYALIFTDTAVLYRAELLTIAFGFAAAMIAWALYTYRLDRVGE